MDGELPATEHQFLTTGIQSRLLFVPEDVLDALESDLAVEDVGRPVETKFQKSSKVVLRWG